MKPNKKQKIEYEMRIRLCEELHRLREQGWSGVDIADELLCSKSTVSRWQNGTLFPNPCYLRDLYEIGCDIMYILTGEVTRK